MQTSKCCFPECSLYPLIHSLICQLLERQCKTTCCIKYLRVYTLTHVQLFGNSWTIARQAPLSMGFPRREYWSGLPCLSPGDLPDPGTEPAYLMYPLLADGYTTSATWENPHVFHVFHVQKYFFHFNVYIKVNL